MTHFYFQEPQTAMHLNQSVQQAVSRKSTLYLDFTHHLFLLLSSMCLCSFKLVLETKSKTYFMAVWSWGRTQNCHSELIMCVCVCVCVCARARMHLCLSLPESFNCAKGKIFLICSIPSCPPVCFRGCSNLWVSCSMSVS
jgi:hypothetical protein